MARAPKELCCGAWCNQSSSDDDDDGDSVAEVGSQRRERRRPRERVDVELCETENPRLLFGRFGGRGGGGVLHLLLKHGRDLTPTSCDIYTW
jgi:hypothetical protein